MILDRNGEPLAVSTPVETVWADPRKLVQHLEAMPRAGRGAGARSPRTCASASQANAERGFMYLKRRVSFDEAARGAAS